MLKGKGNRDNSNVHCLGKRKHPDSKSIVPEIWLDTLNANLEMCRQGIEFELKITSHLKDNNFLTPGRNKGKLLCSFFQFEEAVFK